jgi:hypothetical protein
MKMLGGVFVLRGIAAADMSAGETESQMDPGIAHLQTFLATMSLRLHIVDLVKMSTFGHILSVP